jgi:peroxiredoxin
MRWRGTSTDASNSATSQLSLRDRLLEIKAGIAEYVRPENQATSEHSIAALKASGTAQQILRLGERAPEFTLEDQNFRRLSSAELRKNAKLVVLFFRGRWCPFCIAQLEDLRESLPHFTAKGASVVAISPQTPKHNSFLADQHKLSFPVLSDPRNETAHAFRVAYKPTDGQLALWKSSFVNLELLNGDASGELPMPATFVMAQDGTILYSHASDDYTDRPELSEALSAL